MAYTNLVATIGPGLVSATLNPGVASLQTQNLGFQQIPSAINYAFGNSGAGNINVLYATTGNLVGTTVSIDMSALPDPLNTNKNWTLVRGLLIVNNAVTSGYTLTYDGSSTVTNAWLSPFGSPTPSTTMPKLLIPEGYTDSAGVAHPGFILIAAPNSGFAVGSSNKILKLDSGANTISYGVYLLGFGS
jgi:hypothetical protein